MIGIGLYEEHNGGVAAVSEGRVHVYLEWERLTRVKNQAGWFPDLLAEVLAGLPAEEIGAVCAPRPSEAASLMQRCFGAILDGPRGVRIAGRRVRLLGQEELHPYLHFLSLLVLPGLEAGVYAVLIFDAGQPQMGWVELAEGMHRLPRLRLKRLSTETWFNGELFADFFGKLFYGSRDLTHCGKLMGLSAWGRPRLDHIMALERAARRHFDTSGPVWQGYRTTPSEAVRREMFEEFQFDSRRHADSETLDCAASSQELFRKNAIEQVNRGLEAIEKELEERGLGRPRGLLYSGGCALSVVTNCALRSATGLQVYAAPFAHDASQFVGAALLASMTSAGALPLGKGWNGIPTHTSGHVDTASLVAKGWHAVGRGPEAVARCISAGDVVAFVSESAEAGPRALGNRSLLADATDRTMPDRINLRMKKREWYRPFAPALSVDDFPAYFGESATPAAHYMLDAFQVLPRFRNALAAVTSPDGLSRAQAVDQASRPELHSVIKSLGALSGHPIVLNTSLNAPGLPIAFDVDQVSSDCDALGVRLVAIASRGEITLLGRAPG